MMHLVYTLKNNHSWHDSTVLVSATLKYRHYIGDMIETYKKMLHDVCNTTVSPDLPICHVSVTRGNTYKLVKNFSRYDMCKCVFTQRIINIWNTLPRIL